MSRCSIVGLLMLTLFSSRTMAQESCGAHMTPADIQRAWERYGPDRGPITPISQDILVVTIAWHVLGRTTGEVAMTEDELQAILDMLNNRWDPIDIEFKAHPVVDRIIDDEWYDQGVPDANVFRAMRPMPNALNIYWAPTLHNGLLCGIAGYSFSDLDSVAMQTTCFGDSDVSGIMSHEIGHWFDLFHTFEHALGLECVARTNCSHAGDFCCDTPADFNTGFEACVNPDTCRLRHGECSEQPGPCDDDPFYEPSTINFMSYIPTGCLKEFTSDQYDRMRYSLETFRPGYVNTGLHAPCPGDQNGDLLTDIDDLLVIINGYGNCTGPCPSDLDGNGIVNVLDLLIVFDNWGSCFDCTDPFACDDGDPNTIDYCWFGTCVHDLESR